MSSNEKIIKSRQQQKTDVSTSWKIAGDNGFIPKKGEIIVYGTYDSNNNKVADRPRLKVGDGISNVNDLPFAVDNDVFYFSFTAVLDELPEDRLFTAPYETEFNIQLLDCSVEDLFYAANTYKHVVGLFSFEADGITETECLHLIHKSTALLFKGESFFGSGMGLRGMATPAIDSALVIEPADSGCLARYARCGFDKKIVFINTDLDALLTDQSLYDGITEKFLAYRTLGIDVGLSAKGAQLFLVEHSDDCTVFKSLPLTNGLCVIVTLDHTTRRIQASIAPAIDVSMRKPDEIAGGAAGAQLLISWYDGDIYSTASSEFTLQDIIDLRDGVDGLAHNIKDSDNNGIEQKADAGYSYVDTGNYIVNSDVENDVVNDRGDKMPSIKVEVLDEESGQPKTVNRPLLGARGAFASAFGGNSLAVGKRAHAEGSSTVAFGSYSHAEGNGTYSKGVNSHAEGSQTTAAGAAAHAEGVNTMASGNAAHAEGSATVATGDLSHTEGNSTKALGAGAHAEGITTKAAGEGSHAEGTETTAIGNSSHAEGCQTVAGSYLQDEDGYYLDAQGQRTTNEAEFVIVANNAHAEGLGTQALGDNAHAEGQESIAIGINSHAEGIGTLTMQESAHAEGSRTEALGGAAHAEGLTAVAKGLASHAEGNKTNATGDHSHAEGLATSASGENSHAEGNYTDASGLHSHAEGDCTHARGCSSHAEGSLTEASGANSHAEGASTKAYGELSHTEGNETSAEEFAFAAHAEGLNTIARTTGSHAEGTATVAGNFDTIFYHGAYELVSTTPCTVRCSAKSAVNRDFVLEKSYVHLNCVGGSSSIKIVNITWHGPATATLELMDNDFDWSSKPTGTLTLELNYAKAFAHAEGDGTQAFGQASHAEGVQSKAHGNYSHAEGNSTQANGESSHGEGHGTTASGFASHAEGHGTEATDETSHAEGKTTHATGVGSHAEGIDTQAKGYASHAQNQSNIAEGPNSHAEGFKTKANGQNSHAEGESTIANGYSQHVQGRYNIANETSAFIIGNGKNENNRSNAMTVDWDGNAKFAGDVTTGSGNSINGLAAMIGDIDTALDSIIAIQESLLGGDAE